MKYVSRYYLRQKWANVKFNMENSLDIYEKYTKEDGVSEEDIKRYAWQIKENMDAILKELGEE